MIGVFSNGSGWAGKKRNEFFKQPGLASKKKKKKKKGRLIIL